MKIDRVEPLTLTGYSDTNFQLVLKEKEFLKRDLALVINTTLPPTLSHLIALSAKNLYRSLFLSLDPV